jgi:hypothetical protein
MHETFRQLRFWQDGVMLLVMVNDEKPEQKKPGKNAAGKPQRGMGEKQRASDGCQPQGCGGKNAPPALRGAVDCIILGRQDKLSACPALTAEMDGIG